MWASSEESDHHLLGYPQAPSGSHYWRDITATAAACLLKQYDQVKPMPASGMGEEKTKKPNKQKRKTKTELNLWDQWDF